MEVKQTILAQTESFQGLGAIRQQTILQLVSADKGLTGFYPLQEINLVHEWIMQQCIALSIKNLASIGMGDSPPVPYAFLLFGSGGRQEQTFVSDQDNGLIYTLPEQASEQEAQEIHRYFTYLTASLTQGLMEAGYPPCEGNVMASNQRWRGTLPYWLNLLTDWRDEPIWENVRHLLLVSDARMLAGDRLLFDTFQQHLHHLIKSTPALLSRFVSNTLHHQVPLGWFNRLVPEIHGKYRDAIHIKNGAYLPLVNCVRLFALAHGIRETSTETRLQRLQESHRINSELIQPIKEHFQQVVAYRFIAASQWQDNQYQSNSYLKIGELSKLERLKLRETLKAVLAFQQLTSRTFAKLE